MANRVSFSYEEPTLNDIAIYYWDVQAALFKFFSEDCPHYPHEQIDVALSKALVELDLSSSLLVLSALEAAIRIDYLRRVYGRWRDPLSRAMRRLHLKKGNRVGLESDLIRLWRQEAGMSKPLLGELVGAFRYRHWLAHGRYWQPKLGRKYEYLSVFGLAQEFCSAMTKHSF